MTLLWCRVRELSLNTANISSIALGPRLQLICGTMHCILCFPSNCELTVIQVKCSLYNAVLIIYGSALYIVYVIVRACLQGLYQEYTK